VIRPFMIFALPRSRTAWLSEFLSYQGWTCWHEIAIQMRDFSEVGVTTRFVQNCTLSRQGLEHRTNLS
jgi:hypothetical protein